MMVKFHWKNIFVIRDTESTTKHAAHINSTLKTEYMRAKVEKLRKTKHNSDCDRLDFTGAAPRRTIP